MKLCTIGLLLFGLLSLPGKILAECSWVLWEKTERMDAKGRDSKTWELINAYQEKFTCDLHKEKVWKVTADRYDDLSAYGGIKKVQIVPDLVALSIKGGGFINYTFFCFPDTLDPRN